MDIKGSTSNKISKHYQGRDKFPLHLNRISSPMKVVYLLSDSQSWSPQSGAEDFTRHYVASIETLRQLHLDEPIALLYSDLRHQPSSSLVQRFGYFHHETRLHTTTAAAPFSSSEAMQFQHIVLQQIELGAPQSIGFRKSSITNV